jgi:hypothetical protein
LIFREVFERAGKLKEWVELMDHHLTNYFGASFENHTEVQTDFLKQGLRMNINSWE